MKKFILTSIIASFMLTPTFANYESSETISVETNFEDTHYENIATYNKVQR